MSLSARSCCAFVLVFLALCFKAQKASAQDSTQVVFHEEMDTLVKMRYVDRHENVFMTKVPTRHMFRVGLTQSYMDIQTSLLEDAPLDNSFIQLGYEFKFLKAFSVGVSAFVPFHRHRFFYTSRTWENVSFFGGDLKWFPGMRKRIRQGLSANNFSGKYIGFTYLAPGGKPAEAMMGLKLGYQQRFLNHGFTDFALSIHQIPEGRGGLPNWAFYGTRRYWEISTTATYSFAFGDWKRTAIPPLCDILRCDESSRNQFKIRFPDMAFGMYQNRIRTAVGYEHKFGRSSWSIHTQLDAVMSRGYRFFTTVYDIPSGPRDIREMGGMSGELSLALSMQPRYYFLQKSNRLNGKGGNGFSGFYTGLNTELHYLAGRHGFRQSSVDWKPKHYTLKAGPLAGFQQRVFKHGYVDFNTSYNLQRELSDRVNSSGFRVNLGVGFSL